MSRRPAFVRAHWKAAVTWWLTGSLLLGLAPAQAQQLPAEPAFSDAENQAFYDRVAACSAAMKTQVVSLVERHKAGESALRPDITRLTELTFALIGTAYLRGLRGEAADRLLAAAEAQQKDWPASRRQALSSECQSQARKVYDSASFVERMLVRNRAAKRVERLLGQVG